MSSEEQPTSECTDTSASSSGETIDLSNIPELLRKEMALIFGNSTEGDLGDWEVDIETLPDRDLDADEMLVLALFMKGIGLEAIAESTKHSLAYVRNVIYLPRAQKIISRADSLYEEEIRGMKALAVSTMRDILEHGDDKARTTMVEKYFKVAGRFDQDKSKEGQSAEDVIAKMLNVIQEQTALNKELTIANNSHMIPNRTQQHAVIDIIPDDEE